MFRRSRRSVLTSLAAIVLALATARVVAGDLAALHRQARDAGPPVRVVVATRDLLLGEVVSAGDLGTRRVHLSEVPRAALRTPSEGTGRVVKVPVLEGLPVLQGNLVDREHTGRDGVVPAGMRAVEVSTEGSLRPRPGEIVDVLVTFDPARIGADVEPTMTVASGALVISRPSASKAGNLDSQVEGVADTSTESVNVTLVVSIETAHRLAFAMANGTVTLAVAPPDEAAPTHSSR